MSKDRKYIIYKHTNLINNKIYIGQTCQTARVRWQYGGGYKHNAHFYAAIKKYGWHNFKHEILYTDLTSEQANELEIKLIALFDTTNSDKGYNSSIGGAAGARYTSKEDAIQARKQVQHQAYLKMISNEDYAQQMRDKSLAVYYANKDNADYQASRAKSNKKSRAALKQLREQLRLLYIENPSCFSEIDYQVAFGFKDSKNYICNSSKQLQNLLSRIEGQINEKRENSN